MVLRVTVPQPSPYSGATIRGAGIGMPGKPPGLPLLLVSQVGVYSIFFLFKLQLRKSKNVGVPIFFIPASLSSYAYRGVG